MEKSVDFVKINDDAFSFGGAVYSKGSHAEFSTVRGTGASEYASTRDTAGRDISYVEIQFRNYGRVVVLLDATTAPRTVANFKNLVNQGFYNGLTIHRVKSDFMIQGGDPKGNGTGGSSQTIVGEFPSNGYSNDISHLRGTISMARSTAKDSASSQFFICNADSTYLDENYAAFGYVVEGMSVVDAITAACVPYTDSSSGGIQVDSAKPIIEWIKVIEY
ncbi:MAG: peptidylprolyl isomerase [Clostridia bacterium]|nr:peptidylprolyl isomerase [Clostridia bacterium]